MTQERSERSRADPELQSPGMSVRKRVARRAKSSAAGAATKVTAAVWLRVERTSQLPVAIPSMFLQLITATGESVLLTEFTCLSKQHLQCSLLTQPVTCLLPVSYAGMPRAACRVSHFLPMTLLEACIHSVSLVNQRCDGMRCCVTSAHLRQNGSGTTGLQPCTCAVNAEQERQRAYGCPSVRLCWLPRIHQDRRSDMRFSTL